MALTRREACMLIPGLMAATTSYGADEKSHPTEVLNSATYDFNDLQAMKSADHTTFPIFQGKTQSGFPIQLHETELAPNAQPHPPHHHASEEMFLIREGLVEVTIAGKPTKLSAGSVAYIASNVVHGILNVGDRPAHYFVMELD